MLDGYEEHAAADDRADDDGDGAPDAENALQSWGAGSVGCRELRDSGR